MADKGKKGKGGGSGAKKSSNEKAPADKVEKAEKAPVEKAEKASVEKAEKAEKAEAVPAKAAREEHDDHDHDHDHGAAAGHGAHKVDRREYWVIFGVLFALTILEVAVAQIPGIPHGLMVLALVGLAVTKAACVGLFYMHLKHETKILKLTVALPFTAPAVYALVLIGDAAWRLARW